MKNLSETNRRTILKSIGAGLLGGAAFPGIASAQGDYGNGNAIGEFLTEEAEFKNQPLWNSGVADRTGQSNVEVTVGALTSVDIPDHLAPPGEEPPEVLPVAFDPKAVKVSPGTEVTWTWGPGIHHTVTSFNATADDPGDHGDRFDKHGDPGAKRRHTFEDVGTYLYFCIPHGTPYPLNFGGPVGEVENLFGMRGAVRVSDE